MNVLIVEDTPEVRALLEHQVQLLGHETYSCETATAALDAFQKTPYALIVMDLGLPDMDGLELCRQIRTQPRGNWCMILVVTGRDESKDLQAALDAGADDYLIKPVNMGILKVRLAIIERQYQNLTLRNKAERAFRRSLTYIEQAKREWESTADSLSQVICLLDSQGRIIRANCTIEHWNLAPVKAVKGQSIHQAFHPHCNNSDCYLNRFLLNAWGAVLQGRPLEGEYEDTHLHRNLEIQMRPLSRQHPSSTNKGKSFAVFVANDVTTRTQVQEALSKQDRLLLGVAGAMNHLLTDLDFQSAIIRALKTLALAADVDRIYIFETHDHPQTGDPLMSQRFEWDHFSAEAQVGNPEFQNIPYSQGFERWYNILNQNKAIRGLVREFPQAEQDVLMAQNIISILIVPITINERVWGFIGFDNCHSEYQWRDEEEAVLFAMAASIGGAIARDRTEEQLKQTSTELRALFQALPDDYFRLGADKSILDYKMDRGDLYLNSDNFMGKWAAGLLPEKVETQFDKAITHVQRTQKLMTIEYMSPTSHGKRRYEEVRLLPFLNQQVIVVSRDITDRKEAEEELRQHRDHLEDLVEARTSELTKANIRLQKEIIKRQQTEEVLRELNQKLEDASRHKSNFLANMSHELRTPLNAMIGYTSLTLNALREELAPKHLQNLTKAEQSARVLLQLINDVLDFSKIEAGKMDIFLETIALNEILDDVVVIAEGLLLNKAVDLQAQIAPELPLVHSDFTKLKQILNNLLGNAVKFTQLGFVAVRARSVEQNRAIFVEIEDSGAGIPEDKLEHIFESFKQVDGSISKKFGGSGLGLAITKKFCELLGIDINVRSQEGKGTAFYLRIPVQASIAAAEYNIPSRAAEQTEDSETTDEMTLLTQLPEEYSSILIIDDDEMNLSLISEIFSEAGYRVYEVTTGEEGITLARQQHPDIILMDLVLPGIDGFETTRRLCGDAATASIPIIACSAVATKEFHEQARQAGCIGYITKPIEPERLITQVRQYIATHRPTRPQPA